LSVRKTVSMMYGIPLVMNFCQIQHSARVPVLPKRTCCVLVEAVRRADGIFSHGFSQILVNDGGRKREKAT